MSDQQTATPTAFPPSGTFGVTQRVTLLCDTPGAVIHYTMDGTTPTAASQVFDPWRLPVLEAIDDGEKGVTTHYTVKAIAIAPEMHPSPVATFDYTIARRDQSVYLSREVHPGVHQIRDFDDTKMMLIVGTKRALLVDAGLGRGNLRAFVEPLVGDRPLDVVITHGHPDHIVATSQFQRNESKVFMNHRDREMVAQFSERMTLDIDLDRLDDLHEGMRFDIGGRVLDVYEVPGHTQGHVVLFDEANGLLFASDAVGSNRPTITDSLWMQFPGMSPIDTYLSALQVFRGKVAGKIKEIYGGHNDETVYGEAYLDNLEKAAQRLVDEGKAVLTPSLRPIDADVWQVVEGDRLTDPDWAAINLRRDTCLTAPHEEIATLSNLTVTGAAIEPGFKPDVFDYAVTVSGERAEVVPTTTSTRSGLTVDGASATSRATIEGAAGTTVSFKVTSPNGRASNIYTLATSRS